MSNLPKEAINSDTLKPEASPFGKKPHGPLGRSIAVDTALGYIWKDYADRPHEWLNSARSYMAGKLRAHGIVNNVTIDTLIKRTLNMAEENEWLGNRRMTMRCFGTVCRNYEREKREAKAHVTPHVAQLLQERAIRHPELFNQDGSPKTDKGFYETGFQPDITGATAIMEQYEAAQRERDAAKEPSELDKVFGPKEARLTDKTLHDELNSIAEQQATQTKDDWSPFWISVKNLSEGLDIADLHEYVHDYYGVESAKDTGKNRGEMLTELKGHFNAKKAQLKAGVPPTTKKPSNLGDSEPSRPTTTAKQDAPIAPANSTDENGIKDDIRRRYNKPQRGNDYLVVQGRVLLFRIDHPDWGIETDHVLLTETTAVCKAVIRNADGHVIASGHGRATEAGTKNLGGRYVEKAETAAIGRALALAGYGTDDSLDDSDYLSDSPKAA